MSYHVPKVLLGCCVFSVLVLGQTSNTSNKSLQPTPVAKSDIPQLIRVKTITAPSEKATGFSIPVKCDGDANIYYRGDSDDIVKLNQKGEEVAVFKAVATTEKKIDSTGSFAVAPEGDLYEVVYPHEFDRYVYTFKTDGSFKSAIKVDPGFIWMPQTLGVFTSGQMLISGSEYDRDRTAPMLAFTGIFSADGALLKEVKLEDDDTLHEMAASGDARVSCPGLPHHNRAVDLSQAETASDGNVYLMRWTNPAIIYAISPGGEVVRRLKVDPGDAAYRPATMHVSRSRIAVLFADSKTHDKIIKIMDFEGHEIATYSAPHPKEKPQETMLGNSWACYTENPEEFVFVGTNDDYKVQLWIAEAR